MFYVLSGSISTPSQLILMEETHDPMSFSVDQLNLGPLFSDPTRSRALTNVEVLALMKEKSKEEEQRNDLSKREIGEVFSKTMEYLSYVNESVDLDVDKVKALRTILEDFESESKEKLHSFEIVGLINMAPEDAEAALVMIPSLGMMNKERNRVRFGVHDIEKVLDHLKTAMPSLYFDDGAANGDSMEES